VALAALAALATGVFLPGSIAAEETGAPAAFCVSTR
jgi:hypothetical protein